MRKYLSMVLAFMLVLSTCPSAYASEFSANEAAVLPTCSEEMIIEQIEGDALPFPSTFAPISPVDFSTNGIQRTPFVEFEFECAPDTRDYYSEVYYLTGTEDITININACTWSPAITDLAIGLHRGTNTLYYHVYTGGAIVNKTLTFSNLPRGEYMLFVKNPSTKFYVSGLLRFNISG